MIDVGDDLKKKEGKVSVSAWTMRGRESGYSPSARSTARSVRAQPMGDV